MKKNFNKTDVYASWLIREKLQWLQDAINNGSPWVTPGTIERDVKGVHRLASEIECYMSVLYMANTITLEEYGEMYDGLKRIESDAVIAVKMRTRKVTVRVPA